ncbi:hypothetical protein [Pseudooceanicola nanhaiensis]|uniref:hypothetical protein n=1 Tax=Pseudooceanicola nanhaiensis TaxID=375761 RepID=UPI001CD2E05E|nr:hypothetical protein [Pseudooceanicola nanhaiensis]MCA0921100.1 hypothetical protein [Pseudooceanicola nanhaiensis]
MHKFTRLSTFLSSAFRRDAVAPEALADIALPPLARVAGETLTGDTCEQLELPSCDETEEERLRAEYTAKGQFLARQDCWADLDVQIRNADASRRATPGGTSLAGLLARGARKDAVQSALTDIANGRPLRRGGIDALEDLVAEHPGCWGVALVVARAHMDIGWGYLGRPMGGRAQDAREVDSAEFQHHVARAAALLEPYCGLELDSPELAAAACDLALAEAAPGVQSADMLMDTYEDLIDLDPHNPAHPRAMGPLLLPRWFGSYERLDRQARDTAKRTADIWEDGGYAAVWTEALATDPEAAAHVDVALFIEGLHDILDQRPDQHTANRFAAFAALTMAPGAAPGDISRAARDNRAAIHAAAGWILRHHLRELHPIVWADAALPLSDTRPTPSRSARITQGTLLARRAISAQFAREIAAGQRITFSPLGLNLQPMA